MRYLILILCLVQYQVQASDWLNRTIRVDLDVQRNHRAFDPNYDILERSERFSSGVNATNGQFPWSIMTMARSSALGIACSGSIINSDFVLSDLRCVGQNFIPPANTIEAYVGSVSWNSPIIATHFVRSYWYIAPSVENSPNIVLFRMHETITFNPNVHPIRLPFYQDFAYEGWSSLILGFQSPDGSYAPQLQSAQVTSVFNNDLCTFDSSYRFYAHIICGIDSSGPDPIGPIRRFNGFTGGAWIVYEYADDGLVFNPVLIGIHQHQYANHTASYGYATRVSHFVDWIDTLSGEN